MCNIIVYCTLSTAITGEYGVVYRAALDARDGREVVAIKTVKGYIAIFHLLVYI